MSVVGTQAKRCFLVAPTPFPGPRLAQPPNASSPAWSPEPPSIPGPSLRQRGWDDPGKGQLWGWDEVDTLFSEWPQQKPPSPHSSLLRLEHLRGEVLCSGVWVQRSQTSMAPVRSSHHPYLSLLLKTAMIRPVWHGVLFMLPLPFLAV